MTQTIDIYGTYTIAGSESLHFKDMPAFDFGQVNPVEPPVLINHGTVDVVSDDDYIFATLVGMTSKFNVIQATFWNKAGGEFNLTASGDRQNVIGFDLASDQTLIRNDGHITMTSVHSGVEAIYGSGGGAPPTVVNNGSFVIEAYDFAEGLVGGSVTNTGLLSVRSQGSAIGESGGDFVNSGTIEVAGGQWSQVVGVSFSTGDFSFENTGTISVTAGGTTGGVGVQFDDFYATGFHAVFDNAGVIQAKTAFQVILANGSTDPTTIFNSGQIIGDIQLQVGEDKVINTGEITGAVVLGDGDDVYRGGTGLLTGQVQGGEGDDRILGGKAKELLIGDDLFYTYYDGADTISGGKGGDTLIGGHGADLLTGGKGSDHFVFDDTADSTVSGSDLITDLHHEDVVDLSAIDADITIDGDQAFILVGSLDGRAGEAALSYDAGADQTALDLDVDGDGVADARILIAGDHADFTGLVL